MASTQIISSAFSSDLSSTTWSISNDCLRVKSDSNIYAATSTSSGWSQVTAVSSWIATDDRLRYVLTSNAILKYENGSYISVYTFTGVTFTLGDKIYSYGTRIMVCKTNSTAA